MMSLRSMRVSAIEYHSTAAAITVKENASNKTDDMVALAVARLEVAQEQSQPVGTLKMI